MGAFPWCLSWFQVVLYLVQCHFKFHDRLWFTYQLLANYHILWVPVDFSFGSFLGYLMCFFEEKIDEITLEKLQDFEFAVSWSVI